MNEKELLRGLDKPLIPLIKELRSRGYKTRHSCTGHSGKDFTNFDPLKRGYITIEGASYNLEELRDILDTYGLEDIEIKVLPKGSYQVFEGRKIPYISKEGLTDIRFKGF